MKEELSKDAELLQKNQTEILEMKRSMMEIKNSVESLAN
jgi:hypothetical protein